MKEQKQHDEVDARRRHDVCLGDSEPDNTTSTTALWSHVKGKRVRVTAEINKDWGNEGRVL